MKKTNPFSSLFSVRVLGALLVFLCVGIAQVDAQNYKPLEVAVQAVAGAVDEMRQQSSQSTPTTLGNTSVQVQKHHPFTMHYFEHFIREARESGSVATAVANLNAHYANDPAQRQVQITNAKNQLMPLITY